MIPKIIHYCWFGLKEKPESILAYIRTWREKLPDYQIIEWNENNFDVHCNTYVSQAYELKKFAFVSDVCRLHALKQMGGIYLDTDVQVLKTFDPFLDCDSFIGEEQNGKLLGTAVIGATKGTAWINDFLSIYASLKFVRTFGSMDITANTERLTKFLKKKQNNKPRIYPVDYFCAKDYQTGSVVVTHNTVCVHHYSASWVEPLKIQKIEAEFWKKLRLNNFNITGKIYGRIWMPIKKRIFF